MDVTAVGLALSGRPDIFDPTVRTDGDAGRRGLPQRAAPALNQRWEPILGEPLNIGIGINTGVARVGNTGSQYKFKYGPLGNPVNLASRVQGATKYLRCPLLIMSSPQDHVVPAASSDALAARVSGPVERVTLERSFHVATLDYDRVEIERRAVEFAKKVTAS